MYFEDEAFVCEGYTEPGWYFWVGPDRDSLKGPYESTKEARVAFKEFHKPTAKGRKKKPAA